MESGSSEDKKLRNGGEREKERAQEGDQGRERLKIARGDERRQIENNNGDVAS